jgi:hypothetical protein
VTYGATGCSGSDVITASATVDGSLLSASGTITVAPASVGSIEFISAVPQKIGLRGTGGAGISETATLAFKVVDSTGGPVAGQTVNFSLDTNVGGIIVQPASAVSGADGRAQTVIQSGTVATSVRVTATVAATNIATQSSQLTVTTGLPDKDSVSLSVSCSNVEAWSINGTQVDVTMRMSDRFNNPVPDGTAVTFNTEGGSIAGSCTTATTANESGICSVKWTSANPRPANGRSTVIATAIGEETYTDVNQTGYFDDADTWTDLAEPFRDDNEDGDYDPGEYFFDFFSDFMRTAADGKFNGLLCGGPGNPGEPSDTLARCSTNQKLGISDSNLIIMSGSNAFIADSLGGDNFSGAPQATLTGGGTVIFTIGDLNDQPMPSGTTVSATTSNGKLVGPTSYTIPCTSFDGPLTYPFSIEGDVNAPASGILTIKVTVPSGLESFHFVTIVD